MEKTNGKPLIKGFTISPETLDRLEPIHRIVAEELIKNKIWRLKPNEGEAEKEKDKTGMMKK